MFIDSKAYIGCYYFKAVWEGLVSVSACVCAYAACVYVHAASVFVCVTQKTD